MVAYSSKDDLLLGSIPISSELNPDKIVQDASDEIDSKLGHIFDTPFDLNEATTDLERPARLLIKRINNFLATGRLILAVASPEENQNLHAYGWQLIQEANAAIAAIISGDITLEGVTLLEKENAQVSTPLINNLDAESNVEAFYDRIANPDYVYLTTPRYDSPDRLYL